MRHVLLCAAMLVGVALPATAEERPAYCAGTGTERLPECGWKEAPAPAKPKDLCTSTERQIRQMWMATHNEPDSKRLQVTRDLLDAAENVCREHLYGKPTPVPPELLQRLR